MYNSLILIFNCLVLLVLSVLVLTQIGVIALLSGSHKISSSHATRNSMSGFSFSVNIGIFNESVLVIVSIFNHECKYWF